MSSYANTTERRCRATAKGTGDQCKKAAKVRVLGSEASVFTRCRQHEGNLDHYPNAVLYMASQPKPDNGNNDVVVASASRTPAPSSSRQANSRRSLGTSGAQISSDEALANVMGALAIVKDDLAQHQADRAALSDRLFRLEQRNTQYPAVLAGGTADVSSANRRSRGAAPATRARGRGRGSGRGRGQTSLGTEEK